MSSHRNTNKAVIVKKFPEFPYDIEQILKADVESSNRGILTLLADGRLILTTWVNKKVASKIIEDVSDACWQCGGESEVIIVCHNGMLVRYTLHFDTGLSCSLQLSAPSLLTLIREKDSSIRTLRSPKALSYTSSYILLQLQSDRLAVLATNGGGRPSVQGVVRTPPLRTAHLCGGIVLVQPVTGCQLHEYSATTCRLLEIISLNLQRVNSEFIEWGSLACSSTGDSIALVDSERHLYVSNFRHRIASDKKEKGGINRSKVLLHQIIWPSNFQPSRISQISLAMSDTLLSVFCLIADQDADIRHYLSFDMSSSSLSCHHMFVESAVIAPGLHHQLPDLFIISDGVAMLMDEDVSISSMDSEVDFGEMLTALDESLKEQNIAKVTEVKAMVEQGLSAFMSSCNHREGWVGLAEIRAQQYGKLADLLLSHIPSFAQDKETYSLALALKNLAEHHFHNVQEEMANVLHYVDNESISQMVLQMKEQVSFYLRSVGQLQLPEEGADHKALSEQYLAWGDRPMKQIIHDALSKSCVEAAESYLQLKPWVYGTVITADVIAMCIDIAREKNSSGSQENVLVNMDESYNEQLRKILHSSGDLFEVETLGHALKERGALSRSESMAVDLIITVHRTRSDLLTLPPRNWSDLVCHGDASTNSIDGPLTVGQVASWTPLATMLVMTDLYVCTQVTDILKHVDADVMWQYLLHQCDAKNLKRWISMEFTGSEIIPHEESNMWQFSEQIWTDPIFKLSKKMVSESSPVKTKPADMYAEMKNTGFKMLMGPQYASDSDSSPNSQDKISVQSIPLSINEADTVSIQSFDMSDRTVVVWPLELFKPITQSMVDLVLIAGEPFAELILNILANLGVFVTSEKKDASLLMRRLLVSNAFEKLPSLPKTHECQIPPDEIHKVILEEFGRNNLFMPAFDYINKFLHNDLAALKDKFELPLWATVIPSFMKLNEETSKEVIYDLSLKNLSILSASCQNKEDLELATFLTMLFAPTKSLEDFLNCDYTEGKEQEEISSLCTILTKVNMTPRQVAESLTHRYPYLKKLFSDSDSIAFADVTIYDLLHDSIPYDLSRLFQWQPENRHGYDAAAEMPSFTNTELIKSHGLKHSLDYMYYLRNARPSYACGALIASFGIDNKKLEGVKNAVYGLALSAWPDREICSACIALLYMSNQDPEPLRIILAAATSVLQARNERCSKLKMEKRQAQEHLSTTEIRNILEQMCSLEKRKNAAMILLGMLEDGIISLATAKRDELIKEKEDLNQDTNDDIEVIHPQVMSTDHSLMYIEGMRLCVELSRMYNLPWPVKLLNNLAEANQWLLFIILAQVFKCPRIESLRVAEAFQSMALKEHMTFALTHIHYYRDSSVQSPGSRSSKRNLRSALYSRIGIKAKGNSGSPTPSSSDEKQRSSSPSEYDFSAIDDALSITTTETCFDVGLDAWLSCGLTDLYSILLTCHQKEDPGLELATAAVALQAPVLSILAACYTVENSVTYLSIWLYTQLMQESKKKLHLSVIRGDETLMDDSTKMDGTKQKIGCCRACDTYVLQAGIREVKCFMLEHITKGSFDILIEGLKIFFPDSPLLPLLQALNETKLRCNKGIIAERLSQCALAVREVSQGKSDEISQNKEWFAKTVVDVIGIALDTCITNRHLQFVFLNEIKAVSQQHPFCDHDINWNLLSELCKTLGAVRCQVNFKDLMHSFEKGNLKKLAEIIIDTLTSGKYFTEALKVCQLVNIPTFEILCSQVCAEFDNQHVVLLESPTSFKEFLKKKHTKLCEEEVPIEHSANCFLTICKQLERSDFRYFCLQYAVFWMYRTSDGSSSSSAVTTPVFQATKSLEDSRLDEECMECEMWLNYVRAYAQTPQLPVTPLFHLGHWPWEGTDGTSPLNRSMINKASGFNEMSPIVKSINEENDNYCHVLQCLSGDDAEAMIHSSGNSNSSSPRKITKEVRKDRLIKLRTELDESLVPSISKVVELCLDNGMIITACRILRFFDKSNEYVDTLLQMLALIDGSENEKVDDLSTADVESVRTSSVQNVFKKKRMRSRNISVNSSLSLLSLDPSDEVGIKTPALIKKSAGLKHGRKTAERIIMLYRVASSLDLSYLYVIHHPTPVTVLALVLRLKGSGVIQMAKDLIHALPIPRSAVINFLCEEAVSTITAGPANPGTVQSDRLLLWEELEMQWRDLITLCEDPSAVGSQLLEIGQRLGSSYPEQLTKVHSMSVELVIRAHDCFTAASNMEGISTVLRTSFYLTTSLLQHSQWSLMVRLLTGVGRYGEMSYIIDALREHDQFEPLLGRSSEPKGCGAGLDRALVHYLRSKYPDDTDTLILVALHFLLYSEVAGMWSAEADKAVERVLEVTVDLGVSCSTAIASPSSKSHQKETTSKNISKKHTTTGKGSTPDRRASLAEEVMPMYLHGADKTVLTEAMQSYAHAAQYYMRDQQLTAAVKCSHSAELVALQIAHVQNCKDDTALRLLKLSHSCARCLATKHLNVCEALIVCRAYDISVDWSGALYHQFVVNGDESYLAEFMDNFTLSTEILLDVVKKLEHGGVTKIRQERIANLLSYIEEADVVYRVASQLGLKNIIETCLSSTAAPYLKDTVFKKGFTQSC